MVAVRNCNVFHSSCKRRKNYKKKSKTTQHKRRIQYKLRTALPRMAICCIDFSLACFKIHASTLVHAGLLELVETLDVLSERKTEVCSLILAQGNFSYSYFVYIFSFTLKKLWKS